MNLLENLNKEQLEAVMHKDGPLLIVAGAGTGKTTVITQRLAYLIEQGLAEPDEILALTFTEKAAGEMADRVDSLMPYGYFDLWISTFHSFSERILKEHGLAIGLPTDFKLFNEFEQWALVKKNLHKFELDYYRPLGNPTKFIRALIKHFSRAKDEDISPASYLEYADGLKQNLDGMLGGISVIPAKAGIQKHGFRVKPGMTSLGEEIAEQEAARLNEVAGAYHVYEQLLLDNNALDFGDLINYCLKLFRERPAILEKYRGQFKYILLDEFQDTNWSQYELIKILAAPKNNLVVVGDDDQSIFRFRGASMSNILQFVKDYPQTKKIILTKNYRSKQNILDLSYRFIKQNDPNRLEWQLANADNPLNPPLQGGQKQPPFKRGEGGLNKKLIAENGGAGEIAVIQGDDLAEEVKLVADKIIKLKTEDKTLSWNDFAVLIRANDSAVVFMAELDRQGLPYIFGASRGLYLKPIIMDVISYFKLLDNYHESAAVWRILNLPIYEFSYEELVNFNHLASKKALSLYEVLNQAGALKFSLELQEKIKPVLVLIAKQASIATQKTASEVFLAFMNDSGYLKYLIKQPERKSLEALGLLNQFLKRIQAFESASSDKTVKAFLTELNLELEAGEEGTLAADFDAGPEAIRILTVHGAKGLEFKYVFIVNLVDKRFPTVARSEQINLPDALIKEILPVGDVHLEEERRLFYVAMTRAKAGLYFSWARDYGGIRKKKPSRFLEELGLVDKAKNPSVILEGAKRPTRLAEVTAKRVESQFRQSNNEMLSLRSAPLQHDIVPSHFSYSQLAAYSSCPYQYRFAHILKIPSLGKEQFSFGKTMHATLQKLFILVNEKRGLKQAGLFENQPNTKLSFRPPTRFAIAPASLAESRRARRGRNPEISSLGKNPTALDPRLRSPRCSYGEAGGDDRKDGAVTFEEILKLYEQSWIDDWYKSKSDKQDRREQGREILKVFYEKHKDNWPKVLFLEKGFNLKIIDEGGTGGKDVYTIRGAIDRVDQTSLPSGSGQVGGLKLVDYKTGQAKKDLSFEEKEQLFIYQLAAEELFKQPVNSLAFYYLENNSEIEFIGDAGDLEKIKAKIISTIEEIRRGKFLPKPSRLCAWCDYRGICEFRE